MKEIKVTCKEVISHICSSIGEDLDSPKCVEIRQHLEGCKSCKTFFRTVESTIQFYKQYNVEVTEEIHNRLWEKLDLTDDC